MGKFSYIPTTYGRWAGSQQFFSIVFSTTAHFKEKVIMLFLKTLLMKLQLRLKADMSRNAHYL